MATVSPQVWRELPYGGLPTELSWKIFLDRYTMKDPERDFRVGDLAVLPVVEDRKWSRKEVGEVVEVRGETIVARVLTGPDRGQLLEFRRIACDRPIETTLQQVAERIARGLAAVEPDEERRQLWQRLFAEEIAALRVVPGGRIWAGAGTGTDLTLFNCFVIPSPHDSRHGIVETLGQMMEIMARGGGVGINVSSLRPYRAPVRSVNGRSSGAVSWMEIYSYATGLIEQAGARRGALMLQLDCRHPDLQQFIDVKKQPGRVENANISVRITDEFMRAVKEDREWVFWFPDTTHPEYDRTWRGDFDDWERRGLPKVIYGRRPAREVWREIVKAAWECAEPGVVFSTRHEKDSNSWYFNPLICTNPCAEQPLPAWGVCTLGHINLARMYDEARHDVDWDRLRHAVRVLVRLLDNVIDASPYFMDAIRENQLAERRIGAGTMGLGELLIRLRLRYGSPEAVEFTDRLYRFIAVEAYRMSVELAREKGPFPRFDAEKYLMSGFMQRMPEEIRELVRRHGIRNVTVLTQAPTGTVGTMVDTSTGIEPFYAFEFVRRSRLGEDKQYVRVAKEWMDAHPGEPLPDYFVTANDLTPEEHVRMQAAIQRWTDSSISKTANCPADYTVEDTERLYMLAYDLGCKGITIYRDRSRHEQVLYAEGGDGRAVSAAAAGTGTLPAGWGRIKPVERPRRLQGITMRKETPLGNLYITLNTYEGRPFEVFCQIGKAGSDVAAFTEAIARLVSLCFRCGIDPQEVIDQLAGIGGSRHVGYGAQRVRSVPDALAQALDEFLRGDPAEDPEAVRARGQVSVFEAAEAHAAQGGFGPLGSANGHRATFNLCPECGSYALVYQEGCVKCMACGHSEC